MRSVGLWEADVGIPKVKCWWQLCKTHCAT